MLPDPNLFERGVPFNPTAVDFVECDMVELLRGRHHRDPNAFAAYAIALARDVMRPYRHTYGYADWVRETVRYAADFADDECVDVEKSPAAWFPIKIDTTADLVRVVRTLLGDRNDLYGAMQTWVVSAVANFDADVRDHFVNAIMED